MFHERDPVVLVVDDEVEIAETYRLYLSEEYDVRVAASGEAGLEKLDNDVDVVLLDRRMPGVSGDEVLEEIRARGVDCRVVMVTAVEPDLDILDMAFDEYVVKPVTKDRLRTIVDRMLARDRLKQQILDMFALASKLATLERRLDIEQLEESEQYQQLLEEFTTLRDGVELPDTDEYYSDATLDKFQALVEARPKK